MNDAIYGLNSYQRNEIRDHQLNSDPHQLVLLLMENAISKLSKAKQCDNLGKLTEKGFLIGRTTAIIDGLRDRVDLSLGENAFDFDDFYNEIDMSLEAAVVEEGTETLNQVITALMEIKEIWADLAHATEGMDYRQSWMMAPAQEYAIAC